MPHPGDNEGREARRAAARRRLGLAMGRLVMLEALMAKRAPSGGVEETPAAGRMSSVAPEGEPADQAPDPPAGEQEEKGRQAGA
jgi:hypothetical protein